MDGGDARTIVGLRAKSRELLLERDAECVGLPRETPITGQAEDLAIREQHEDVETHRMWD